MSTITESPREVRSRATASLVHQPRESCNPSALERIVELNMGVARSVAHRYRNRGESDEDLEQVAYLALVKAARGFDAGRGKDFLTYAVPTIDGELKRHFRDRAWLVRPPRRIQSAQARIAEATDLFAQDNGRLPTASELAGLLDIEESLVEEALTADGCYSGTSLDLPVGTDGTSALGDFVEGPDTEYEQVETCLALAPLLASLQGRDAFIVRRRFVDEATQREIAAELGVTQMQVSRLLARILARFRDRLDDAVVPPEVVSETPTRALPQARRA